LLETIVDKHVLMHRWLGVMMVVCAFFHILGHFLGSLPAIMGETDTEKINAAFTHGTHIAFNFMTWRGALMCRPAYTGLILVALLICFWSFSCERVRRWYFQAFQYPHFILMTLWVITLTAHGSKQWLGIGVPLGLCVALPALLFFAIERWLHIRAACHPAIKIAGHDLKKRVIMLDIDTAGSGYEHETGMYCMLRVPKISEWEWHPFTIASGGEEDGKVRVMMAVVGDWTKSLYALINEVQTQQVPYPVINLRGGYGAPAQSMASRKHIVMVGAGVGATPFLSFLANVCHAAQDNKRSQFDGLISGQFFWVTREPEDFLWVKRYTNTIAKTPSLASRLKVNLCLTKAMDTTASKDVSAAEAAIFWLGALAAVRFGAEGQTAVFKELGVPTQFGRPNWVKELTKVAETLPSAGAERKTTGNPWSIFGSSGTGGEVTGVEPEEVCVYVCGNQMLTDSVREACEAASTEQVVFLLFAEQF